MFVLLVVFPLIEAILSLIGSIYFLFLAIWLLRDLVDDLFYSDKHSIEMMQEIVKGGKYKSMTKNIIFGQCSQNHDCIRTGIFALVDKKTDEIEIKTCSRPDDGLIASGTTDA